MVLIIFVQLDRIQNLAERASALYNLPMAMDIVNSLSKAQESLRSLERGNEHISVFVSTGCRGRPSIHIPKDLMQLYIDYHFPLTKIGQIFGVSSKTIQTRIVEFGLVTIKYSQMSDEELDEIMLYVLVCNRKNTTPQAHLPDNGGHNPLKFTKTESNLIL